SDNLVVMYQVEDASGDTVYGLIPRKDIEVADGEATFYLKGEGNYQAAILPEFVDESLESDPITVPILTAEEEEALPAVSLAQPTGTFNSGAHTVALVTTASPASTTIHSCVAVLDEDKQSPYDHVASFAGSPGR